MLWSVPEKGNQYYSTNKNSADDWPGHCEFPRVQWVLCPVSELTRPGTVKVPRCPNFIIFSAFQYFESLCKKTKHFQCSILKDPKNLLLDPLALGITEVIQPLLFYSDPDEAPALLKDVDQKIRDADGFVVISSEYNSAIPPALASVMDNFPPPSYAHRPAAIISYSLGIVSIHATVLAV